MGSTAVDDVIGALEEEYGLERARALFEEYLAALTKAVDALPQGGSVAVTIPTSRFDFVLVGSRGEQLAIEVKRSPGRPGTRTTRAAKSTKAKGGKSKKTTAVKSTTTRASKSGTADRRKTTVSKKTSKKQKKSQGDTAKPVRPGRTDSPGPSANHEGKPRG